MGKMNKHKINEYAEYYQDVPLADTFSFELKKASDLTAHFRNDLRLFWNKHFRASENNGIHEFSVKECLELVKSFEDFIGYLKDKIKKYKHYAATFSEIANGISRGNADDIYTLESLSRLVNSASKNIPYTNESRDDVLYNTEWFEDEEDDSGYIAYTMLGEKLRSLYVPWEKYILTGSIERWDGNYNYHVRDARNPMDLIDTVVDKLDSFEIFIRDGYIGISGSHHDGGADTRIYAFSDVGYDYFHYENPDKYDEIDDTFVEENPQYFEKITI